MRDLYNALRHAGFKPMGALRWIYGPDDLPAARLPNFMDARRDALARARGQHADPAEQ